MVGKYIESVDTVLGNSNILVFWIACDGAEMVETVDEEEVMNQCTALLRSFFNNPTIPRGRRCLRTRWNTNPYTRGVYSCLSMDSKPGDMADLARPVEVSGKPRLLFAGEATTVAGHGFMHGARDSGLREAERLLNCYNFVSSINSKL